MKFKISQSDFSKAILAVNKSLPTRANLPILTNMMIVVSGEKLEVLSTNLETATKVNIGCKCEKEGRVTLPGKALLEFVSQIPEGEVTVEKLGEEVLVSINKYNARFATMPVEDFPAIPQIENGETMQIDRKSVV